MVFLTGKSEGSQRAIKEFMARYECFSRATQPEISLLLCATEALELSGFKVRSAKGASTSLIDGATVQRIRDRVVVQLDQTKNDSGLAELQCVVCNEAIATSKQNPCRDVFDILIQLFNNHPGVKLDCLVLQ